jgi:peptidyl-tRNA hydrolase, PTH1 family
MTGSDIKLVVGLGNPGKQYAWTRHNIGRHVIEAFENDRPAGVHLFIPDSYMNLSGGPVAEVARRKGCQASQILVVSDDFMLPLGTLRLRRGGSSGGHNGLKSIFEVMGTQEIPRLRVGIGPVPEGVDPKEFVLQPFRSGERALVEKSLTLAVEAVRKIADVGLEAAMNEYNAKRVDE